LPAITGLDELVVLAALRSGVDAQLLVAEPSPAGSFRYRHALTRDAVARRLLPQERALLSRRAVDAIEAAHPGLPGEWCDLAAQLADDGGDHARAATLLLESGRRSLARGALASAEDVFERARALAGAAVVAADAADGLCESLSLAGKIDRALEVGLELSGALTSIDAVPERIGGVHLRLARAAATACRWDVANQQLELARRRAGEANDAGLAARVDAVAAQVAFDIDTREQARDLAGTALTVAERMGLHDLRCEALEVIGRCARLDNIDEAERAFAQALAVATEHELVVWRIRALFELSTLDLLETRSDERLLATRELALAAGALATVAQVDLHLSHWHIDRFEPEESLAAARRSSDLARRFRMDMVLAMSRLGEATALGRLGRDDKMEAIIREVLDASGDDPFLGGMVWGHCRPEGSLIADNQRRALRELDTAMDYLRQVPTSPSFPGRGLWALLRAVNDVDGDAACAEVRASGATVHRMVRGFLLLADAVLCGRAGRLEEAERAFAAGDAELSDVDWYRHLARRLVAEAAILDGWGDPVAWMQQALIVFEDREQDRLAAACRSLLHKAGAPVPRRGADALVPSALRSVGVTRREMEVLTLLADGLGNKEISARLYLSPRTVERHIANLSAKSGLRTRSELVAFAARSVTQ
jgi:DNA-binding CsgD family transcriptional regulator/tetratricopeptide (TPR) repeat protein